MRPTNASRMSSRVMMPDVPPYSSTTTAIWWRDSCSCLSTESAPANSGTTRASRTIDCRCRKVQVFLRAMPVRREVNKTRRRHRASAGKPACGCGRSRGIVRLSPSPWTRMEQLERLGAASSMQRRCGRRNQRHVPRFELQILQLCRRVACRLTNIEFLRGCATRPIHS